MRLQGGPEARDRKQSFLRSGVVEALVELSAGAAAAGPLQALAGNLSRLELCSTAGVWESAGIAYH